jgi:hypothetical protein
MCTKGSKHSGRQRNTPLLAAFGQREHQRPVNDADLALYMQSRAVFVGVIEGQTEDLALP